MLNLLPLSALATISLGALVLYRAPRLWTHRLFAAFTAATGAWTLCVFLSLLPESSLPMSITASLAFAMPPLAVYALLLFFHTFARPDRFPRALLLSLMGVLALFFSALSFTSLIASAERTAAGPRVIHGFLYFAYAAYLLLALAAGAYTTLLELRAASGLKRLQLKYLALGLLLPGSLALLTNLLVPYVFKTSQSSHFGPLFSLVMIIILAHPIAKHHLLDLRAFIGESVTHIISSALSVLALGTISLMIARWYLNLPVWPLDIFLVSLPFALLFQFLRRTFEDLLGRYLQRKRLDVKRELRISSADLAKPRTQRSVCAYLLDVITRHMPSTWVGVYVRRPTSCLADDAQWVLVVAKGSAPPARDLDVCHPWVTARQLHGAEVVSGDKRHQEMNGGLELRSIGADLVVALSDGCELHGLVVLGSKASGDPYFSDDIDLLSTLANQAGVAIRNAQLYEQVALINEHLRNIVSTIESGVVAVNEVERVTMFNSAAERLSGLASDEMVGRPLSDLPVAVADSLLVTLASGLPRVAPEVELARVGSTHPVPVICCTSPLRGPTGGLVGAVAVFSDLTPLKELETERRRAERLAYFETLAAGIAHEIKNPLVAIKTFLQLLPRRFNDPQFRDEFGRVAGREIGRMEHLVARLQSLAKPGGRTHHPVDLRAPVNDALELLQPRLEEKAITTQWSPEPGPCLVMGDHAELEQLFLNLFINALEAMGPRGALTVRMSCRDAAAAVAVEDTGPGIRDDLLGKIFDPFVTTKLHGSGLGLAICSSIATAHRARLRAVNKPGGRGAIFTVELPLGTQVATPLSA